MCVCVRDVVEVSGGMTLLVGLVGELSGRQDKDWHYSHTPSTTLPLAKPVIQ